MNAIYDALAELLKYPAARAPGVDASFAPGEAGSLVDSFLRDTASLTLEQLQELYVRTFDLNPVCSLEIGWHLFGENYERGEFLVKMRQEMRRYGVPESTELPDHLTHVLPVAGRMAPEEANEFIVAFVLPALEKMRAGLAGKNNPYEKVLAAIGAVFESNHASALLEVMS